MEKLGKYCQETKRSFSLKTLYFVTILLCFIGLQPAQVNCSPELLLFSNVTHGAEGGRRGGGPFMFNLNSLRGQKFRIGVGQLVTEETERNRQNFNFISKEDGECGGTLEGDSGRLTYEKSAGDRSHPRNCIWIIKLHSGPDLEKSSPVADSIVVTLDKLRLSSGSAISFYPESQLMTDLELPAPIRFGSVANSSVVFKTQQEKTIRVKGQILLVLLSVNQVNTEKISVQLHWDAETSNDEVRGEKVTTSSYPMSTANYVAPSKDKGRVQWKSREFFLQQRSIWVLNAARWDKFIDPSSSSSSSSSEFKPKSNCRSTRVNRQLNLDLTVDMTMATAKSNLENMDYFYNSCDQRPSTVNYRSEENFVISDSCTQILFQLFEILDGGRLRRVVRHCRGLLRLSVPELQNQLVAFIHTNSSSDSGMPLKDVVIMWELEKAQQPQSQQYKTQTQFNNQNSLKTQSTTPSTTTITTARPTSTTTSTTPRTTTKSTTIKTTTIPTTTTTTTTIKATTMKTEKTTPKPLVTIKKPQTTTTTARPFKIKASTTTTSTTTPKTTTTTTTTTVTTSTTPASTTTTTTTTMAPKTGISPSPFLDLSEQLVLQIHRIPPSKLRRCPNSDSILPCTCSLFTGDVHVECSGSRITQESIYKLFEALRRVNKIPLGRWIILAKVRVQNTQLTQLDLLPFFGLQTKMFDISFNKNLRRFLVAGRSLSPSRKKGQSVSKLIPIPIPKKPLIQARKIRAVDNALTDSGIGETLHYFSPELEELVLYKNRISGNYNNHGNNKNKGDNGKNWTFFEGDGRGEFLPGLSALTQLSSIYLSYNQIHTLRRGQFKSNTRLMYLGLTANGLERIEPLAFVFKEPPAELLNQTLTIDLSRNQINETGFPAQHGLDTIKRPVYLDLDENQLESLSPDKFETFLMTKAEGKPNQMSVRSNPFFCDSRLGWLKKLRPVLSNSVLGSTCTNEPNRSIFTSRLINLIHFKEEEQGLNQTVTQTDAEVDE